ncbi:MAG: hypothetical protein L3J07_04010 [Candidatus Magasanikbacteria bacterium]|nr:hypothetical protein [Candidatus Magasanikbacteria bacterium]
MKKLLGFILLLSIFTFPTFLVSCGDEGSPPFTLYNNTAEDVEPYIDVVLDVNLHNCDELAWVENVQECCADDTGCLPATCSLEQKKYECWISCPSRFAGAPTTNTRFSFDHEHHSFKVDYREFGILTCN